MLSKIIGGILLIVGTSIGGGMLALPVASAGMGFWSSALLLFICWVVMTLGAFFILEVTLYLPPGKNIISMAAATLGKPGLVLAWLSYLLLLYSLLSAYISGGSDVFGGILSLVHLQSREWILACLFTLSFGAIAYMGIRSVDLLNRGLMFAKLGVYVILVVLFLPFIQTQHYHVKQLHYSTNSVMIFLTSFGYAIIVPNLREYFQDNIQVLRKVILIGSFIPLVCYLVWNAVIMGVIPPQGASGLMPLMQSEHATSTLAQILSSAIHNPFISLLFTFFTSICMLTAFLGVSLCLISFLADGLNLPQKGKQGFGLFLLTFLPPFLLVIYYPGAYLHALAYAGIFVILLLLFLPAMMSLLGRKNFHPLFIVPGGRVSQWAVIISSIVLFFMALWD